MYKTFDDLSVSDDVELRDARRIRRLYWKNYYGLYAASGLCAAAGTALLGLAAWAVHAKLSGLNMPAEAFWTFFAIGALGALMTLWMAWLFSKELRLNPLRAFLKDPAACIFAEGRIEEADYLYSGGSRSRARMNVKGSYGEGGIFFADFDPGLWSRSVADRGEDEGLKPGDDRFPEKGKRVKLPLPAWVLYNRADPGWGMLAGIPAATVALLKEKAGARKR